jgi:hypothetical protein
MSRCRAGRTDVYAGRRHEAIPLRGGMFAAWAEPLYWPRRRYRGVWATCFRGSRHEPVASMGDRSARQIGTRGQPDWARYRPEPAAARSVVARSRSRAGVRPPAAASPGSRRGQLRQRPVRSGVRYRCREHCLSDALLAPPPAGAGSPRVGRGNRLVPGHRDRTGRSGARRGIGRDASPGPARI